MQSLSEVSLQEFQKELTPQAVRAFKIIYSALALGVLFFSFIIFILYTKHINRDAAVNELSYFNILSLINAILIIATITGSKLFYNLQFSMKNLQNYVTKNFNNASGNPLPLTPAQRCLSLIRSAGIMRLAVLESSAFCGLVFTLLAVQTGAAFLSPVYLLNALSIIPMLVAIAVTFPSADKLEGIFESKIKNTTN